MRGSPRSVMLTWANTIAGWWTSAAVREIQKQQRALARAALKAMQPPRKRRQRRR